MILNKYFKKEEFKCHCGCALPQNIPNDELLKCLTEIREHFNAPLIVKSAYRCVKHNEKIGGAKASRHLVGDAVDFVIKGVKTKDVYEYVEQNYQNHGVACKLNKSNEYAGFVHFDCRGYKARWHY